MTLEALGQEYAAEAENLAALIAACKERLRTARRDKNSNESARLFRLAELNAKQQEDLADISAFLQSYYGGRTQTNMKGHWLHI